MKKRVYHWGVNFRNNFFLDILRNSVLALILKISGVSISLLFNIVLAKVIGVEGTGVYFTAIGIVLMGTILSSVGLNSIIIKFVAKEKSNNQVINHILFKSIGFSFCFSLIISILIYISSPHISNELFEMSRLIIPLKILSFSIPIETVRFLIADALKGKEKYVQSLMLEGFLTPAFTLLFFFFFPCVNSLNGICYSFVGGSGITVLIGIIFLHKGSNNLSRDENILEYNLRFLITESLPVFTMNIVNFIITSGDILILAIWLSEKDLGIYGIAKKLATVSGFLLIAANTIIAPKFSILFFDKKFKLLKELMTKTIYSILLVALPILLIVLIFPDRILSFFGESFSDGSIILIILVIGTYFHVGFGITGTFLIMCGFQKVMKNNIVFTTSITILLYFLIIPTFGALGAALVTSFGLLIQNIIPYYFANTNLKKLIKTK